MIRLRWDCLILQIKIFGPCCLHFMWHIVLDLRFFSWCQCLIFLVIKKVYNFWGKNNNWKQQEKYSSTKQTAVALDEPWWSGKARQIWKLGFWKQSNRKTIPDKLADKRLNTKIVWMKLHTIVHEYFLNKVDVETISKAGRNKFPYAWLWATLDSRQNNVVKGLVKDSKSENKAKCLLYIVYVMSAVIFD